MNFSKTITSVLFLGSVTLGVACKSSNSIAHSSNIAEVQLLPDAPAWAALWMQRAAEYRALCFQAYNYAKISLDEAVKTNVGKPLAVVTDIDETVLDNSPYTVHQVRKQSKYTPDSWKEWTAKSIADTVPGAPSFFQYAASKGVTVFYITNRSSEEGIATLKNLQKWNFPFADSAHLVLMDKSSDKESRRQAVAANYTIVMYCGDNLGDFSSTFNNKNRESRLQWTEANQAQFGVKYIAIPNVMYGNWEDAYYNGQPHATFQQTNHILDSLMKDY
ncbi:MULTISPECIES: 5'-nucleotidase, lipoprotein e(P4) family [Chitinophagaceae]